MEDGVMVEGGGGGGGGDEDGGTTQQREVEVSETMEEVTRCSLGDSKEALELRDMSPMLQQYLLSLTPHTSPLDK